MKNKTKAKEKMLSDKIEHLGNDKAALSLNIGGISVILIKSKKAKYDLPISDEGVLTFFKNLLEFKSNLNNLLINERTKIRN